MLIWCSLQMDVMRGPCTPARSAGMGLWALGSIAGTVIQMLTWAKFLPGSIDAEVGQSRQCDPEQRPQWTLRILTLLRPSVHQMFVSNKWQFFITALLPPSPWRIFFFFKFIRCGLVISLSGREFAATYETLGSGPSMTKMNKQKLPSILQLVNGKNVDPMATTHKRTGVTRVTTWLNCRCPMLTKEAQLQGLRTAGFHSRGFQEMQNHRDRKRSAVSKS